MDKHDIHLDLNRIYIDAYCLGPDALANVGMPQRLVAGSLADAALTRDKRQQANHSKPNLLHNRSALVLFRAYQHYGR